MPHENPESLGRMLVMEVGRVTEAAAIACARLNGRGDRKGADGAAVDAMRRELSKIDSAMVSRLMTCCCVRAPRK